MIRRYSSPADTISGLYMFNSLPAAQELVQFTNAMHYGVPRTQYNRVWQNGFYIFKRGNHQVYATKSTGETVNCDTMLIAVDWLGWISWSIK